MCIILIFSGLLDLVFSAKVKLIASNKLCLPFISQIWCLESRLCVCMIKVDWWHQELGALWYVNHHRVGTTRRYWSTCFKERSDNLISLFYLHELVSWKRCLIVVRLSDDIGRHGRLGCHQAIIWPGLRLWHKWHVMLLKNTVLFINLLSTGSQV